MHKSVMCLYFSFPDGVQNTVSSSSDLQQTPPQALHYALANAQQVQIHQIGEDGQVQVVSQILRIHCNVLSKRICIGGK